MSKLNDPAYARRAAAALMAAAEKIAIEMTARIPTIEREIADLEKAVADKKQELSKLEHSIE